MNKNPCSNQEIHSTFEHGLNLKILKMSPELFTQCYNTESVADQTDNFAYAFVRKNISYGYDDVTML